VHVLGEQVQPRPVVLGVQQARLEKEELLDLPP